MQVVNQCTNSGVFAKVDKVPRWQIPFCHEAEVVLFSALAVRFGFRLKVTDQGVKKLNLCRNHLLPVRFRSCPNHLGIELIFKNPILRYDSYWIYQKKQITEIMLFAGEMLHMIINEDVSLPMLMHSCKPGEIGRGRAVRGTILYAKSAKQANSFLWAVLKSMQQRHACSIADDAIRIARKNLAKNPSNQILNFSNLNLAG